MLPLWNISTIWLQTHISVYPTFSDFYKCYSTSSHYNTLRVHFLLHTFALHTCTHVSREIPSSLASVGPPEEPLTPPPSPSWEIDTRAEPREKGGEAGWGGGGLEAGGRQGRGGGGPLISGERDEGTKQRLWGGGGGVRSDALGILIQPCTVCIYSPCVCSRGIFFIPLKFHSSHFLASC